jgi:hypothetical protein
MPEPKIKLERYWRKSFPVEGVQVTEENMEDVATWCGGYIQQAKRSPRGPLRKFIKVRVYQPRDERQTMAFEGDRILYAGTGFKVYTNNSFLRSFMPEDEALAHKDPIYRDAVTGHFIPEDEAEAHPDTSVKETSSHNHSQFLPPVETDISDKFNPPFLPPGNQAS